MKYEYFGIIATGPSGATAVMELISGRERTASRIAELIESDHAVRLFECKAIPEFEIATKTTVTF